MTTRIERLKESLRKEQEKLDIRKLNNAHNRIKEASLVLVAHTFQNHRLEAVERLKNHLTDASRAVWVATSETENKPVTGGE